MDSGQDRYAHWKRVFASDDGRRVLADLVTETALMTPIPNAGHLTQEQHIFSSGQKHTVACILERLGVTPADLFGISKPQL